VIWKHFTEEKYTVVVVIVNKYVAPPYCWTEMYAGCVACCPLLDHGEFDDKTATDGQTNGCLLLDAASVINKTATTSA